MRNVLIKGESGQIEGKYFKGYSGAPSVLILHSHFSLGSNMNDLIICSIFDIFVKKRFSTLKINFRGVGQSQGNFDNGEGEVTDASNAIDWLKDSDSQSQNLIIIGFSFGAFVALDLINRRPDIKNFILVSPPLTKYNFYSVNDSFIPGLLLFTEDDYFSSETLINNFVNKINKRKNINIQNQIIKNTNHFFNINSETAIKELTELIKNYINN